MVKKNLRYFFKRLIYGFKNNGIFYIIIILLRLYELTFRPTHKIFKNNFKSFENKKILEIGGPSKLFASGGLFPFYTLNSKVIDNINFSGITLWEGHIRSKKFKFNNKILGSQFINEASNLFNIKNNSYDVLICSEMIQHSANPIQVLLEFKRVLKKNGLLLITIPLIYKTFDHNRQVTKLSHMILDFKQKVSEEDETHINEVLEKHDLSMDLLAGSFENFKQRCQNNYKLRGVHHHCFNKKSSEDLLEYVNFKIITSAIHKNIIILLCKK